MILGMSPKGIGPLDILIEVATDPPKFSIVKYTFLYIDLFSTLFLGNWFRLCKIEKKYSFCVLLESIFFFK